MKRVVLSTVLVVVLAVSAFPVMAQGTADPIDPDLEIWVDEAGDIRLCLPLLCFDTESVDTILTDLQTGMALPTFKPLYDFARGTKIDVLSIDKAGQVFNIGVNSSQLAIIQVEEVALEELLPLLPGGDLLKPWLLQGDLTAAVYFGDQEGELIIEEMASFPEPTNFLEADVVISSAGEVLSLAGLQPNQLGAEMSLGASLVEWFDHLEIKAADLQVSGNVVSLAVNGEKWLQAALDLPQVIEFGASYVPEKYEEEVDLATAWLLGSDTTLHLEIAEEPKTEAPHIAIERIVANLSEDGLTVEGLELPMQVPENVIELLGDGITITLDGPAGQIRTSGELEVGLDFEPGFVAKAGPAYLPEFDWEWVEKLVGNTTANLEITVDGGMFALQPPEFVEAAPTFVALEVPVSVGSDGSIGLWGEKLPKQLGLNVEPLIPSLRPLRAVGISGRGVKIDVDGSQASLFLVGKTRRKVLVWAIDSYRIPYPYSEMIVNALDNALNIAGDRMVVLTLDHLDTPVPPGILERGIEFLLSSGY